MPKWKTEIIENKRVVWAQSYSQLLSPSVFVYLFACWFCHIRLSSAVSSSFELLLIIISETRHDWLADCEAEIQSFTQVKLDTLKYCEFRSRPWSNIWNGWTARRRSERFCLWRFGLWKASTLLFATETPFTSQPRTPGWGYHSVYVAVQKEL